MVGFWAAGLGRNCLGVIVTCGFPKYVNGRTNKLSVREKRKVKLQQLPTFG